MLRIIVPTLIYIVFATMLYPACGLWAIPIVAMIGLAAGAAWGAIASQLREPPPLGSPANPQPMPAAATATATPETMTASADLVIHVARNRTPVVADLKTSDAPENMPATFDLGDLPKAAPNEVLHVTKRTIGARASQEEFENAWKRAQAMADEARAQSRVIGAPVWTASQKRRSASTARVTPLHPAPATAPAPSPASDWFDVTTTPVILDFAHIHHTHAPHSHSHHEASCGSFSAHCHSSDHSCGSSCGGYSGGDSSCGGGGCD